MFDIGFSELVLVAIIALLVLGPERLPTAARTAGRWVGRARRLMSQVNQEIDKQIKLEELRDKLRKEGDTLGAEKVQETIDSALSEAKKFEHLVNQEISEVKASPASAPAADQHAASSGDTASQARTESEQQHQVHHRAAPSSVTDKPEQR